MQLMLEDLELRYKVLSNAEMLQACGAIEGTIDYAKSLIIKEKEQIIKAHENGQAEFDSLHYRDKNVTLSNNYYTQTHNQNK